MNFNKEMFHFILIAMVIVAIWIININLSNIYKELRRLNAKPGIETIAQQIQQQTEFFKGNEIK